MSASSLRLKRLFDLQDSLSRQMRGVEGAIALAGAQYSKELGYLVPLRTHFLKQEVGKNV